MSHFKEIEWANGSSLEYKKFLAMKNNDDYIKGILDTSARGVLAETVFTKSIDVNPITLVANVSPDNGVYNLANLNFSTTDDNRDIHVYMSFPMITGVNNGNSAWWSVLYIDVNITDSGVNPGFNNGQQNFSVESVADGTIYVRNGFNCCYTLIGPGPPPQTGIHAGDHTVSVGVRIDQYLKWTFFCDDQNPGRIWVEDVGGYNLN